jgi:hypothetical protein
MFGYCTQTTVPVGVLKTELCLLIDSIILLTLAALIHPIYARFGKMHASIFMST